MDIILSKAVIQYLIGLALFFSVVFFRVLLLSGSYGHVLLFDSMAHAQDNGTKLFLGKVQKWHQVSPFFAQGADIVLFGVDWSCDWCLTCCYPIHWLWIFVPFPQIIDVDASTLYALAPYCGQRESWKQNHVTDAANKTWYFLLLFLWNKVGTSLTVWQIAR